MVGISPTRPRWYRLTPGRFVVGALAVVALLWLSERFGWFTLDQHKGWAVLIAVAAFAAALLLLVFWFVAALLFRRRFQFGIRALLLLTLIVALLSGWMTVKIRAAKEQHDAVAAIVKATQGSNQGSVCYDNLYATSPSSGTPTEPQWLRDLLGDDFFYDVVMAYLSSDVQVKYLYNFGQLQELFLDGESVTDHGLEQLKALSHLEALSLNGNLLTARGVSHLQTLPQLKDLYASDVYDEELENLMNLSGLRTLKLWDPGTTEKCMKRLQRTLPNCNVQVFGYGLPHQPN